MNKVLSRLRKMKVTPEKVLQRIRGTEYECDKAATLIGFLIREGTKYEILQLCKLLREQGMHCENLADLIEGNTSDGRDTGMTCYLS